MSDTRFNAIVKAAAQAAVTKAQMMTNAGIPVSMYLYYRTCSAGADGVLVMVADDEKEPAGYKLATGAALRGDKPYDEYEAWISAQARKLPLLGWDVE